MIITEAYEDIAKTKLVKASSLNWEDYVSKDYYCPGENCNCIVHPKALNSNIIIPHFAKIPSSNHIAGCKYIKASVDSEIDDVNTSDFNLIDLLNTSKSVETDTPTTGSGNGGGARKATNKLTTIRKAYKYFEASNPYDLVNGVRILDMYCGRNTGFLYKYYITGFRLVECQYYHYENVTKTIYFKFPYETKTFVISASFASEEIFKKALKQVYNFSNPILILADFDRSNCIINKLTQIVPVKR